MSNQNGPALLFQASSRRLLRMSEACRYLGCSRRIVNRLVASGRLRALHFGYRQAFDLRQLDDLVESLPDWGRGSIASRRAKEEA